MNNENKTEGKQQRKEWSLKVKKSDGSIEEVEIPWFTEEDWAKIPEEQKCIHYFYSDTSE